MSRSFKKTPVFKDGSDRSKIKRYRKRRANKKVRRWKSDEVKFSSYKKIYESWDICDYRFYGKKHLSGTVKVDNWEKWYLRK